VAQETLRASIAGADAAAARRKAVTTTGYYNLKLGDAAWRFGAGLGITFTDNAHLAGTGAGGGSGSGSGGDLIFSPSLITSLLWPISEKNSLNVSVNAGYSYYTVNNSLSRFFITPGTEISFDVYVGDFSFNFYDRPSLTQNAYEDPSVAGGGDTAQFQNTAGIIGQWELNKASASFGYSHNNHFALGSQTANNSGSSDTVSISFGAKVRPEIKAGVELGGGFIENSGTVSSSARQWNAGGFLQYSASTYLNFRLNGGYTVYSPDQAASASASQDQGSTYVDLAVSHIVNKYLSYTLGGGRGVTLSLVGQPYESYHANLGINWRVLRNITLNTPFAYTLGTDSYGGGSSFSQYQIGITLGRELMKKLSGSLGYNWIMRDSEGDTGDYTVNTVSLNFSYQF